MISVHYYLFYRLYVLRNEVDFGDVKAVPHPVNCRRPFKLRHGEPVAVMTKVERNLCKKNTKRNIIYQAVPEHTFGTTSPFAF